MFGRSSKLVFASLIVQIAFEAGYLDVQKAKAADKHITDEKKLESQVSCLVSCGLLTEAQAADVMRRLEKRQPYAYMTELARQQRDLIHATDTGIQRLNAVLERLKEKA